MKLDYLTSYEMIGIALLIGTPFFVFFGSLSDRIGRLKIILAGCLIAALTFMPLFHWLARSVNPDLTAFQDKTQITVSADPAQCHFNVFVGPWSKFGDCDKAKDLLTKAGLSFTSANGAPGSKATITVGDKTIEGFSPFTWSKLLVDIGYPNLKVATSDIQIDKATADQLAAFQADKKAADIAKLLSAVRMKDPAGKKLADVNNIDNVEVAADGSGAKVTVSEILPVPADKSKINWGSALLALTIMMLYVTMVYGPIAAFLVELFPTAIRYTSMSLPYHIGNGWFGGMLPLLATAIVAWTGNIYYGLWYPVVIALMTVVIGGLFLRDTKDVDIAR